MTYEKDIPDFALVPARPPEERILVPVTQGAVYSPVQVTNITEKPKTIITLEEDILVPDTRPDLKEILQISGTVRLASRELDQMAKKEDAVALAGDVELQTLYVPEKSDIHGPVIAIAGRIHFREQWHTTMAPGAWMTMESAIESIDYMVINERKFRVKLTIAILARECQDQKLEVFEGIAGEEIQTLRETVEITNIALRKKDILTIHEVLDAREGEGLPESILKQDIHVVENYRQATAEKIVVNGFVHVSLLYTVAVPSGSTESPDPAALIHQRQDRVEFTQFIPLSQSGQWSGSNVTFDGSDLRVKLAAEEDGGEVLRLEGDIQTWAELYRNVEKEIIVDGYHREKDFVCDFKETACRTLVGTAVGEGTVREVVSLENPHGDAEQILYVTADFAGAESHAEPGKIITEGLLRSKILCLASSEGHSGGGSESRIFTVRQDVPFRCVTAAPQLAGGEIVRHRIYLKDLWAEKSGSHQAELNASILVSAEMMRQAPFKILQNPAFEEVQGGGSGTHTMVVYMVKDGDSLWSIAKQFKSTVDSISQVNQMEDGQIHAGQKLLILR